MFRRGRGHGHGFESHLCKITGVVALVLVFYGYSVLCSKEGVSYMIFSSLLYTVHALMLNKVAQWTEHGLS